MNNVIRQNCGQQSYILSCSFTHVIISFTASNWLKNSYLLVSLLYHKTVSLSNDASLRDIIHLLRKYDVARFTRNDAMFALMCPQAHIIHHWHSQHHLRDRQTSFKKRTFVTRQKCVFCWSESRKLNRTTFKNCDKAL